MDVPTRIAIEDGTAVVIEWEDGSETHLTAQDLRAACSCAACREPAGEQATQRALEGEVGILAAQLVGGYAVNFTFSPDGHGTGIFPYDVLRSLGGESS